jgi:glucosylceramidase
MQAKATITTCRNGKITRSTEECFVTPDTGSQERDVVNIYPKLANQQIDGFGGAITESVGYTLSKMPLPVQKEILDDVFGTEGLRYTLVRTSIDSCDFSLSQYEASSAPGAPFDLRHDETYVIPYIQAAQEVCPETIGVMLTPWSPPAYMKSNGERSHGGKLKPEYYSAWAEYICRYIRSYQAHGLNVVKLSIQNEPNANQLWDSCLFSGEEEKTFLRDYLCPALQSAGLNDIAIYIWDHNKERLFDRVCEVVDETTAPLISGAAFHWYSGDHFDALRLVRAQYPSLSLLFSEGCIEYNRFDRDDQLQSARMYAHDMIGNFNAGMNTFLDWNIVLNSEGGPNHAQNYCDAPILCNTKTGAFEKRLSYYYIWHFSHFIERGARQISTTTFSTEVDAAAFRNADGRMIAVLSNNSAVSRCVFLRLEGSIIKVLLPADSIASVEIEF